MLLTDEEKNKLAEAFGFKGNPGEIAGYFLGLDDGAKAQLKKVVEWGCDLCLEHANKQVINVYKRECPQCWQALLDEVKDV